jgi:hypothetical protein
MSDRSGNRRYAAAPQSRTCSHHFDHRIFSDADAPPGPSHQQPPSESAQAEHAAEDDGSESGAITGCALAFAPGFATPREGFTLTSVADGSWHTVDSSDDGDDSDGGGDHDLAAPDGANVDLIVAADDDGDGDVWDNGGLDFDLGDEFDGETDEEDGAGLAAAGFGCSHYQRNCRWAACSNIARAPLTCARRMVAPCCGKEYASFELRARFPSPTRGQVLVPPLPQRSGRDSGGDDLRAAHVPHPRPIRGHGGEGERTAAAAALV